VKSLFDLQPYYLLQIKNLVSFLYKHSTHQITFRRLFPAILSGVTEVELVSLAFMINIRPKGPPMDQGASEIIKKWPHP
jgi:hypothetical protein